MPLYEYECKQCHQHLEKIQSFSAPPEKVCPKCGGELERVISAPAFQFKGAGWYVNDYAKSGSKAAPPTDATSKSENKSDKSSSADDSGKSASGGKSDAASSDSSSSTAGTSTGGSASSSGSSSSGSGGSKSD